MHSFEVKHQDMWTLSSARWTSKLTFSKLSFRSVKQFGSRSGPTYCWARSGSKLFTKIIRRRQTSIAGKELKETLPKSSDLIVIFLSGYTKSKCCKLWTCCNSLEYQCQHNPQSLSENTCEFLLHTVAGPQVRARNWKYFFNFPTETYVLGTQKNCLNEMVLLSAQNTCLNWWIRK